MAVEASREGGYWFILESRSASSSRYWAKKKLTLSDLAIFEYRSRKRYEEVS